MKDKSQDRRRKRAKRRVHIRKKVVGTAECPRLSVFRSVQNIYGQIIDDMSGKTLISASNVAKAFKEKYGTDKKNKTETSQNVGQLLAEMARQQGVEKVVFDRGGYLYHGRVKALAEGARKGGLVF